MWKTHPFLIPIVLLLLSLPANTLQDDDGWFGGAVPLVKRLEERKSLLVTEHGEISAIDIRDGTRLGPFHLQFITLEPDSLFLPVLLHADMVFYVHSGSGRLNWLYDEDLREEDLRRGDIYRLHPGSVFYLQSSLEPELEKLRIYALFSSSEDGSYVSAISAYSTLSDLVLCFDKQILREAFMVADEAVEEILSARRPPLIVPAVPYQSKRRLSRELEARFLKSFVGGNLGMVSNKKKKKRVYNVFDSDPDFENCNGWSLTVTKKETHLLKGSNVGIFMVNLTAGSMMGPHWNPMAHEMAIVTAGEGMVRVVCPSTATSTECRNARFRVRKGDVFAVPRFHPMAQMSFNNGSFVFVGFSTTTRRNRPQFLAGQSSVLRILEPEIVASSFDVNMTTVDRLLASQGDYVILECTSCAEEEARVMEEEIEREREEEEARRREEQRKREEEEARKREEEEEARREEDRKRKEEEERRREEEAARKREEERKRQEEEKRKREEEAQREEEEARKKEEERKRREEEVRKRQEEEERKRREEEVRKRQEEEEERKRREEEVRKRQEEAQREEERKRQEEEERKQEEERERQKEEEAEREKEEATKKEEERKRLEEEARKREEESQREEERKREEREIQEEEERRRREVEAREREEERRRQGEAYGKWEEERRRQEEAYGKREEEAEKEEEESRKREEARQKERERRQREAEKGEEESRKEAEREEMQRRAWEEAARKHEE